MAQFFAGLMSGTSIDAVDCVIADFSESEPRIIHSEATPISPEMKQRIIGLQTPSPDELRKTLELNIELGEFFADAINTCLASAGLESGNIVAIGSHGQTIRHQPDKHYSLQIGDPNVIARKTGITTISDFRTPDLVVNGQGAPLLPAFHNEIFRSEKYKRCIVNLGGMANITVLGKDAGDEITGYDTGPGNVLMDYWISKCKDEPFDPGGTWAKRGTHSAPLLSTLLAEPYFSLPPPKSTGRELFDGHWLEAQLEGGESAENIQATLLQLTSVSIANAVRQENGIEQVFCCGGGTHNTALMEALAQELSPIPVDTTAALGIDPDWVEATAFAWFAMKRLKKEPANCPGVTGADCEVILGAVHEA